MTITFIVVITGASFIVPLFIIQTSRVWREERERDDESREEFHARIREKQDGDA